MERTYKLIMKYPLAFIFTGLALFIPYTLAILFLHYKPIQYNELNYSVLLGIILLGILYHISIILLWWFVSFVLGNILSRIEINDNKVEWNLIYSKWASAITVGSFISFCFAFFILGVCKFFDYNFKTFFILTILLPIIRLIISIIEFFTIKQLRNKNS